MKLLCEVSVNLWKSILDFKNKIISASEVSQKMFEVKIDDKTMFFDSAESFENFKRRVSSVI